MELIVIPLGPPNPKTDPREQYRNLNGYEANASFAEEEPNAAVGSASWIGSAAKSAKTRCHTITLLNV